MKRLLHFFSLAVLTQIILMLGQLILLPIQLRMWGSSATAAWYSALALATITYFVDCGLRTAGHAELNHAYGDGSAGSSEALQFQQIWSWIRTLLLLGVVALAILDLGVHTLQHAGPYPSWRIMLIGACAGETMLIIRIMYLDTLGRYRGAEASYFFFAALRLGLCLPALLIFHWAEAGLAAVYLISATLALGAQGLFVCKDTPLLHLTAQFPKLSWKALALARHTIAEPLANWMRLSLPVLVIGQISSPLAVTTYVALRAVFGAGRTTIQQLARVASVEFLKASQGSEQQRARPLIRIFVVCAVFIGAFLGAFVVIDNMRLLGLWLKHADRSIFQQTALAFAVAAPFFCYQIPMALMFRQGELSRVARRHYAYAASALLFAGLLVTLRSLTLYLVVLALSEIILSLSFFAAVSAMGRSVLRVAAAGSLVIYLLWMLARNPAGKLMTELSPLPVTESGILLIVAAAIAAGTLYRVYRADFMLLLARGTVAE